MTKEPKVYILNLSPFERIVTSAILPQRESLHIGVMVAQIRDDLSLSGDENSKYDAQYLPHGSVNFGSDGKVPDGAFSDEVEFQFGEQKYNIIKKAFSQADSEKRLPTDPKVHDLYYKVMNAESVTVSSGNENK